MGLWKYNLLTEYFFPLCAFIPNGLETLNRALHFNWFLVSILTSYIILFLPVHSKSSEVCFYVQVFCQLASPYFLGYLML